MPDEVTSSKSSEYFGSNLLMTLLALAEAAPLLSPDAIAKLGHLPKLERPVTLDGLSVALWDIDEALRDQKPYRKAYQLLQQATPERVQLNDEALEDRQPGDEGGTNGIEPLGELVDLAQEDPAQLAKKSGSLGWLRELLGLGTSTAKPTSGKADEKGGATKATESGGS